MSKQVGSMTYPLEASAEVRLIRRKFGLSIPDLATILDVDARTINRWESGQAATPPGALEALRALDTRMQRRLIQRIAQLKTQAATTIAYYRDRAELVAAEPFYLHLPSSLYEWEVAQLVDRLGIEAAYTDSWRERHPYRSPVAAGVPALTITADGAFTIDHDRVPASLAAVLPEVLPALGAADPQRTIAFAPRVPVADLMDAYDALAAAGDAVHLAQPWDDAPTVAEILARRDDDAVAVDVYLVDDGHTLTLELAGIHDAARSDVWADVPTDRAPWL